MKNRLIYYTLKELSRRKKAAFSVFIVIAVSAFVLFSFSMLSYSSYIAQSTSIHHGYICGLSSAEFDKICEFQYVKDAESFCTSDGSYIVFVTFHDSSPLNIEKQCNTIIHDLGYSTANSTNHDSNPYGYVNEQYYNLTITPYVLQNLSLMLIIYLLTCIPICFSLRTKNSRSSKEYGYMRSIGLRKCEITAISIIESVIIFISAIITALVVSIPIHKLICVLTEKKYSGNYVGLIFSISLLEIALIICVLLLIVIIFQTLHIRSILSNNITDLLNEIKTYTVSFAAKTSRIICNQDKIKAYTIIYFMRCMRSVFAHIGKVMLLFALPMFLLIMSISFNESRAYDDNRDFILSPISSKITDSIIQEIKAVDYVGNIEALQRLEDGTYYLVNIYCKENTQEVCLTEIQNIANKHSLALSDIYHAKITLTAQANIFAPYYLFQALIMFLCGLLVAGTDLYYELSTRKKEFAVICAIGYPNQVLKRVLLPYCYLGLIGYISSVIIMFLWMGLGMNIWMNRLVIYPLTVITIFGTLTLLLYQIICKKFIENKSREEIALLFSNNMY